MKISIIVPVFNAASTLEACIRSVLTQTHDDIDIIVRDGGSTDGGLAILDAVNDDRLDWKSEPDEGLYDAMNKGTCAASGDWVLYLGADDYLADSEVLENVARELERCDPRIGLACGQIRYESGRVFKSTAKGMIFRNRIHHQSAFYRRQVCLDHPYRKEYRISADYDLNCYCVRAAGGAFEFNYLVAICGEVGLSKQASWSGYREEIEARHRYFPWFPSIVFDAGTYLRYWRKKI